MISYSFHKYSGISFFVSIATTPTAEAEPKDGQLPSKDGPAVKTGSSRD